MAKKRQYKHPVAECLFCINAADSEEHVYPQWAKSMISNASPRRALTVDFTEIDFPKLVRRTSEKVSSGDPRSPSLRVVCTKCNNNWMGTLQEKNKDIIIAIGSGDKPTLEVEDQTNLAKWAVMTSMVLETRHRHLAHSTQSDRHAFGATGRIPSGWSVWVSRYVGDLWRGHNHFGAQVFSMDAEKIERLPFGIQSTAWVLAGTFFLTAYGSALPRSGSNVLSSNLPVFSKLPIPQIFPVTGAQVIGTTLSDMEADEVSRMPLGIAANSARRAWE